MKKLITQAKSIFSYLFFLALTCSLAKNAGAQILYGTTQEGGTGGFGTI